MEDPNNSKEAQQAYGKRQEIQHLNERVPEDKGHLKTLSASQGTYHGSKMDSHDLINHIKKLASKDEVSELKHFLTSKRHEIEAYSKVKRDEIKSILEGKINEYRSSRDELKADTLESVEVYQKLSSTVEE